MIRPLHVHFAIQQIARLQKASVGCEGLHPDFARYMLREIRSIKEVFERPAEDGSIRKLFDGYPETEKLFEELLTPKVRSIKLSLDAPMDQMLRSIFMSIESFWSVVNDERIRKNEFYQFGHLG